MDLKEKKISSELIYKGKILDLYKDKVECPNGKLSTREVVRHCKAACILAIVDNKVIIEEQYRYPYDEVILEFPAGKIEPGEDVMQGAIRELEEETGYLAQDIKFLGDMYPACAYTDEIISLFVATNLKKTKQNLDENESLDYKFITFEELEKLILTNQIKDAKTIATYQLYLLNK